MCCVTLPALLLLLLLLDQVRGRDQDPRADGRCHGCACQPPSSRSLALPCGLLCGWEGARAITRAAGRSCCCCCRFRRGLGRSATFPGLFRAGTGACATSSSASCCRVEATWLSGVSELPSDCGCACDCWKLPYVLVCRGLHCGLQSYGALASAPRSGRSWEGTLSTGLQVSCGRHPQRMTGNDICSS